MSKLMAIIMDTERVTLDALFQQARASSGELFMSAGWTILPGEPTVTRSLPEQVFTYAIEPSGVLVIEAAPAMVELDSPDYVVVYIQGWGASDDSKAQVAGFLRDLQSALTGAFLTGIHLSIVS